MFHAAQAQARKAQCYCTKNQPTQLVCLKPASLSTSKSLGTLPAEAAQTFLGGHILTKPKACSHYLAGNLIFHMFQKKALLLRYKLHLHTILAQQLLQGVGKQQWISLGRLHQKLFRLPWFIYRRLCQIQKTKREKTLDLIRCSKRSSLKILCSFAWCFPEWCNTSRSPARPLPWEVLLLHTRSHRQCLPAHNTQQHHQLYRVTDTSPLSKESSRAKFVL